MIVRAARDVTKNVSVVVVAVNASTIREKGNEGREEGRKEGKGGEFFGQSTYQPRPAAASFLARRQATARAPFSLAAGAASEKRARGGGGGGGGGGGRHVKKMVLRLSAAAAH